MGSYDPPSHFFTNRLLTSLQDRTFPDYADAPSGADKRFDIGGIALYIPGKLCFPEVCIGFRHRGIAASRVTMPETAMDEYRGTMLCQNDIRFSGQFRTMQPEAETGPVKGLASTALLAAAGSGRQFRKARDLAAWLGLVPREHSTGGKTKLLGISKRGNKYLRRMIVHGARSCVTHLDRSRDRLGPWLDGLERRMHKNKVTVALAAKIARIVWVILTKQGATYERQVPALG